MIDIIRDEIFQKNSRCTLLDHRRNEEILGELKVEPDAEKLWWYGSNWLWHVTWMNNNRMWEIMLNYRPNERRWLGRPLKRLLEVVETGLLRPKSWHHADDEFHFRLQIHVGTTRALWLCLLFQLQFVPISH